MKLCGRGWCAAVRRRKRTPRASAGASHGSYSFCEEHRGVSRVGGALVLSSRVYRMPPPPSLFLSTSSEAQKHLASFSSPPLVWNGSASDSPSLSLPEQQAPPGKSKNTLTPVFTWKQIAWLTFRYEVQWGWILQCCLCYALFFFFRDCVSCLSLNLYCRYTRITFLQFVSSFYVANILQTLRTQQNNVHITHYVFSAWEM